MTSGDGSSERPTAAHASAAATVAAWRMHPVRAMLDDAFDAVAARDLPLAMRRARVMLADAGWCRDLLAPLVDGLRADPLFEPPLTVLGDDRHLVVVLHEAPAARILATVLAPGAEAPLHGAPPGDVVVARYVRAGAARVRRWAMEATGPRELEPLTIADGDVLLHDGRTQAHALAGATSPVVTLSATLAGDGALPPLVTDRSGTTPAAALLMLAVHLADGAGLAQDVARTHPSARLRATARAALDHVRNGADSPA